MVSDGKQLASSFLVSDEKLGGTWETMLVCFSTLIINFPLVSFLSPVHPETSSGAGLEGMLKLLKVSVARKTVSE